MRHRQVIRAHGAEVRAHRQGAVTPRVRRGRQRLPPVVGGQLELEARVGAVGALAHKARRLARVLPVAAGAGVGRDYLHHACSVEGGVLGCLLLLVVFLLAAPAH